MKINDFPSPKGERLAKRLPAGWDGGRRPGGCLLTLVPIVWLLAARRPPAPAGPPARRFPGRASARGRVAA